MITRFITIQVLNSLKPSKVVGMFGSRRTGKTTLMNIIKEKPDTGVLMVHGENLDVIDILSSQRTGVLKRFIGKNKYLFVGEAQKIPKIGLNLKLIVDTIPDVFILISGSSSLDLRNKIGGPLVGRSQYFFFIPFLYLKSDRIII